MVRSGAELACSYVDEHADVAGLGHAQGYPNAVRHKIEQCGALVGVMHATWVDDPQRKLGDKDWVREEIAMALPTKRIFPILLDEVGPLESDTLRGELKDRASRNAGRIRWATYRYDVHHFIASLEPRVAKSWEVPQAVSRVSSRRMPLRGRIVSVLAGIIVVIGLLAPAVLGFGLAETPVAGIPTWARYGALAAVLATMVLLSMTGFAAMIRGPAGKVDRELLLDELRSRATDVVLAAPVVAPALVAPRVAHRDQRRVRERLASEIENDLVPSLEEELETRIHPALPPDVFSSR